MITASHNPPQDNGYKLYLGDGAQIVPPVDEEISAHIDAVGSVADLPARPTTAWRCSTTPSSTPTSTARVGLVDDGRGSVQVVYTAMHGVGAATVRAAFARAGFPPLHEVAEQVEPDPDFPTVAFPNPEEPGALDLSLALGARRSAPTSCSPTTPTPTGSASPSPTARPTEAGER